MKPAPAVFLSADWRPEPTPMVIDAEKDYERASQGVYIVQALRGGSAGIFTADFRLKLKSNDDAKAEVVDSRLAEIPAHALEPYNKALDFSKRGNAKGAIEQLKKPLIAYPDFMLALNELGVKYLKLGELEKADDALRSALKIDPEAFEPLMNHDITIVRMERYQDAEPELRQALRENDKSAVGHFYLGRALAYYGKFEEAKTKLGTAIDPGRQ